jgi:hypothetical protein
MPIPVVVSHVPEESPGITTDFSSHVLATEIEYVNGYDLSAALFVTAAPKVPVRVLLTQKEMVIVFADAVPHAKSATDVPSINCCNVTNCEAEREASAVVVVNFIEVVNPEGESVTRWQENAPSIETAI